MADTSLQQIGVLAVILSLDIARLVRHRRADNSILWIQAAASAEEVLSLALEDSAGTRDSDAILKAAQQTLVRFLGKTEAVARTTAA